ncbi:MAG TPA: hypothetical protein VK815_02240 [Candidatus Acidoferrales bacterium]|jgi:hypothetical protein|nr:hypothetical protein [Candidatus Acidoferrales bacterium]
MKHKPIFVLAFAGFGLWLVFAPSAGLRNWLLDRTLNPARATIAHTDASDAAGMTWSKRLKSPWTDTKVVLYRANGEVVQLDAKAAVYTVCSTKPLTNPMNQHKPFDIPVAAFIDPVTKAVWFGEVDAGQPVDDESNGPVYTNLFIETGREIIRASNLMYDGIFNWDESMVKQLPPAVGWEAMTNHIENIPDDAWPLAHTHWEIGLSRCFRENFFQQDGVMHGEQEIKHIEMTGRKLRLDFSGPAGKSKASIWIDLKTPKVLKTIETKPN